MKLSRRNRRKTRKARKQLHGDRGYVYVLSNPGSPGLLKIGFTTRPLDRRVSELSSASGVSHEFNVVHYRDSPNCAELERMVHDRLDGFRVNRSREFFKISERKAIKAVEEEYGRLMGWQPNFLLWRSLFTAMGMAFVVVGAFYVDKNIISFQQMWWHASNLLSFWEANPHTQGFQ